jgi:hypothetical protein
MPNQIPSSSWPHYRSRVAAQGVFSLDQAWSATITVQGNLNFCLDNKNIAAAYQKLFMRNCQNGVLRQVCRKSKFSRPRETGWNCGQKLLGADVTIL